MNTHKKKKILRQRRHKRVRAKIIGTAKIPRISLFKSNSHIYGQVIDDKKGNTLFSQSDLKVSPKQLGGTKVDFAGKQKIAFVAGKLLAEKMKEKELLKAVFDRGGFKYHGRIKAFAEGIRRGGVKI